MNIYGTMNGTIKNDGSNSFGFYVEDERRYYGLSLTGTLNGNIENGTKANDMYILGLTGTMNGKIVQNSNTGNIIIKEFLLNKSYITNNLALAGTGSKDIVFEKISVRDDKDLVFEIYERFKNSNSLNIKDFIDKSEFDKNQNGGKVDYSGVSFVEHDYGYNSILSLKLLRDGSIIPVYNPMNTPQAFHSEILARSAYYRAYFIDNVLSNAAFSATEQYINSTLETCKSYDAREYCDKALQNLSSDDTPIKSFRLSDLKNVASKDRKYFAFLLPYYTNSSFKINNHNYTSSGNTSGIMGGIHSFLDSGLYGAYIGLENGDQNIENIKDPSNFDMKTYYGGVRYTTLLKELDNDKGIFLRTHLKGAISDTKMSIENMSISDKSGTMEGKAKTYMAGLNADIGALLHIRENTFISPSFGVGAMLAYTPHFKSKANLGDGYNMSINSHSNFTDLYELTSSLKIYHKFTPKIRLTAEGGANMNLNSKVDGVTSLRITAPKGEIYAPNREYAYNLEKYRFYAQFGILLALSKKLDFSVNYNGVFSKDTKAHTGFLQVNWWWEWNAT